MQIRSVLSRSIYLNSKQPSTSPFLFNLNPEHQLSTVSYISHFHPIIIPDTKMAMMKTEKCVGLNHEIHVPEGTKLIEVSWGFSTYPKRDHSTALYEARHPAYSFIVHTNGNKPTSNPLYQLKITIGRDKQIKQININCLPHAGNKVAEVGGIFTPESQFKYQFDTPEAKGSITFDRDHESIGVEIDMTWKKTKERAGVHIPVVVFC